MNSHLRHTMKKDILTWIALFYMFLTPVMNGCGGGGGGGGDGTGSVEEGTGEVAISLTDAPSDFASYTVDVVSISLKKLNGAEVETLPITQRVDFSQYTEMTEFVTACTIPLGVYTEAALTLDYTNADIRVEDNSGNIQKVSQQNIMILDEEEEIVTDKSRVRVSVNLGLQALTIVPGVASHLALDFNLKATNTVDFSGDIPILTVSPMLLADLEPQDKTHRVRGMLSAVNQDRKLFDVVVMPFVNNISGGQEHFGTLRVLTDESTVYMIDNTQYQGDQGLSELAELPPNDNIPLMVLGKFKTRPNRLEAQEVYVGSSVPGSGTHIVNGNVIARDEDDVITIKGASFVNSSGRLIFCKTALVKLNGNTRVSRQFSKDAFSKDDISVGQRIVLFGSDATLNESTGQLNMTANGARMLTTHLRGKVKSISSGLTVVELSSIDGRKPSSFDFTGTSADPANYAINTSGLNLLNIKKDTRVKVWGFVSEFGPTTRDFRAQTVINISTVIGLMHVNWNPADYKAFSEISDQRLILDIDNNNIGKFHFLLRAGTVDDVVTDFKDLPVTIKAPDKGSAFFCIAQGLYFRAYTDFSNFADALDDFILKGGDVRYITAIGVFNDDSATMNAGYLVIRFPVL